MAGTPPKTADAHNWGNTQPWPDNSDVRVSEALSAGQKLLKLCSAQKPVDLHGAAHIYLCALQTKRLMTDLVVAQLKTHTELWS